MQAAIDHLEAHKVFDEKLNTYVVPLEQAYLAIELSIDKQLQQALSELEGLSEDINNLGEEHD